MGARGPIASPAAEDEAAELCRLHVDRDEADERDMARRKAFESWKLSSGAFSPDAVAGSFGHLHAQAHARCLDQVLSALAGPGGDEARRILHEARVGCEASADAVTRASVVRCVHQRKLELFVAGVSPDAPGDRETLDRLLHVGAGAPLSEAQRADYCRTRELTGTGHPFCD